MTVYGISETKYIDGYIEIRLVGADEEDISKVPEYNRECRTHYSSTLFHWIGSKEEADKAFDFSAVIAFCYDGRSVGTYPAKECTIETFSAWLEALSQAVPCDTEDLTTKLVI